MSDESKVIGSIDLAPEPGERPLFTILRNDKPWEPLPGCAHGSFELNTEWLTITCGKCREKIEPFAVLMAYATWYEKIEARSRSLERQHIGFLREQLGALRERVALSDADREEIRRARHTTSKDTTVEKLTALLRRLNDKLRDAKLSKRRA